MRKLLLMLSIMLIVSCVYAQDEDLEAQNLEVITQLDAFGLETQLLLGIVHNTGADAYANITIYADLLDADGELIGEAFGYVVDECGEALLEFPLQPNQARPFLATIDLFEDGEVETIEVSIEAVATAPEVLPAIEVSAAVQRVAGGEVVAVEWEDSNSLRYGVGCDGRVFNTYDWYRYRLDTTMISPLAASPNAEFITDAFLRQTGINQLTQGGAEDTSLFQRSFLTFSTQSSRIVYQTDIHTLITAETDGSFKRVIHTVLSQFSLQGYVWSPEGNFVAYYFGAYGEPVRYFTASAAQGRIGAVLQDNTPSQTVPGLTDDGRRVIISGSFPDENDVEISGYWFSSTITQQRELLFETDELAGNNYPAPAYYRRDDTTRFIYFVRPIEGQATLQCLRYETGELFTLSPLPLVLDNNESAWSWLSPDNTKLAIGANGNHGGLWLVDLTQFEDCQ